MVRMEWKVAVMKKQTSFLGNDSGAVILTAVVLLMMILALLLVEAKKVRMEKIFLEQEIARIIERGSHASD